MSWRRAFVAASLLLLAAKLALAARLPLFVDEAYYWLEGRHLAWAYSDLPGLTAWLARLGTELGGTNALALRAPFVLIAAFVPWLVSRIATRELGAVAGARAGLIALAMPLPATLGHGDVLVMAGRTQAEWVHRIARTKQVGVDLGGRRSIQRKADHGGGLARGVDGRPWFCCLGGDVDIGVVSHWPQASVASCCLGSHGAFVGQPFASYCSRG